MNCCQIATKKHDGGSSEEANQPKRRSVFIEGRTDAFSLYSNKEVRMDRLLSSRRASAPSPTIEIPSDDNDTGNNDIMDTSTTTKTHAITSRRPPRRVTRLSFEVHPSLILDPILLSAVGEIDDSSTLPTNIIFDDEKKTDEQESINCEVGV